MKSATYVYGVTEIYRRLLDEGRAATRTENDRLRELFSRGGFTDRYFCGRPQEPMLGTRSDKDKQDTRSLGELSLPQRQITLHGELCVLADRPATLTLYTANGRRAYAEGDVPAPARSVALTADALRERICRMGGTPYALAPADLAVTVDPGLNLSPGAVNALRRAALAAFAAPDGEKRDVVLPAYQPAKPDRRQKPLRTALFYSHRQSDAVGRELSYFDIFFLPLDEWQKAACRPGGIYVPPVVTDHELAAVQDALREAYAAGIRYALCGNAGMIDLLHQIGFAVLGDFRLNITNRESAAIWQERSLLSCVLSPELALPQIRDIGWGSVIVYGRIPLMLTERCFIKENFGCDKCGKSAFTDRRGARFPILREAGHRNVIVNSLPTYMGDRRDALARAGITVAHFLFTVESAGRVREVIRAWRAGEPLSEGVRRIGRN